MTLRITTDSYGQLWLHIKAPSGKQAVLNITASRPRIGTIARAALDEIAKPFPPPKAQTTKHQNHHE